MIGLTTMLRKAGVPVGPQPIGTCAVCHQEVVREEPYLCFRGLLIHRRCATYRMRREDERLPSTTSP